MVIVQIPIWILLILFSLFFLSSILEIRKILLDIKIKKLKDNEKSLTPKPNIHPRGTGLTKPIPQGIRIIKENGKVIQ